jgi:signal transduction histidine kinase
LSTPVALRFILLEDDQLEAELIQEHVRAAGLHVEWTRASDQSAFQAALLGTNADLILSDFSLAGYDGREAFELAHSLTPGTPFVFVSGAIGEELAIETLRRGAADYVLKDRLHYLPAAVHRALRLGSEHRRRQAAEAERDVLLVSERRAREAAESANHMKDEFLATASHELRTPLNAILGWAKLLRAGPSNAELLGRGLATIERNAIAQSRLIEDILDISRIVTGKVQLRIGQVPVGTIVHAVVDSLRPAAAAKQIEVTAEARGLGEIDADAERLQQILWNLLSNAIKFTEQGGRVTVAAERKASTLELSVSDTGKGIDPAALGRVFEQFWQADPSATRRQGGLGLGLPIVRYLAELHGGRAWAESEGPGLGSRFAVEIPVTHVVSPRANVPASQMSPDGPLRDLPEQSLLGGIRILIVDDDPDGREIVALILTKYGATVTSASSANEALESLRQSPPHVLISDIGMPDVDGYSFIRAVRALPKEHGGRTPALALTAFTRQLDRDKALHAGFQSHLSKPLTPAGLVRSVQDLLPRDYGG